MNKEHFKTKLVKEKGRLTKEIVYYSTSDPYLAEDRFAETQDDSISEIEGHDRIVATKEELEKSAIEVEAALARIEEGTYGICENCKEKISEARLEVMPTARYCLSCQDKKNRR